MALTLSVMRTRVHYLLNQDSSSTNNLVTSAMINLFLAEGRDVLCLFGKVYEALGSTGSISTAYVALSSCGEVNVSSVIEIIDVHTSTGVALTKIEKSNQGKMYLTGTAGDSMYWWQFGDYLYIHPTPSSATFAVYYIGLDVGTLTDDAHTPNIPDEYHYQLINYAAYRGKLVYNQHAEADAFLSAFAQSINMDLQTLKGKIGA